MRPHGRSGAWGPGAAGAVGVRPQKPRVTGVTARAIEVVIETGDSGPVTPIGINLPNDQEIRETHGSKSVSLSNINEAYDKSTLPEFRREFAWTPEEAYVSLPIPGGDSFLTIDRETGEAVYDKTTRGWVS